MVKNAEKIEDSIRDRIQTAKDDTWDEFSLQLGEIRAAISLLQESNLVKDNQIKLIKTMVIELQDENLALRQENAAIKLEFESFKVN